MRIRPLCVEPNLRRSSEAYASFGRVADALYGTENFACKPGDAVDFNQLLTPFTRIGPQ